MKFTMLLRSLLFIALLARFAPAVYIDDRYMIDLTADGIDDWVKPDKIAGIEIYAGTMVPPQFQPGLGGCGSIVIWTK